MLSQITERQIKRLAALTSTLLFATAEALAQEKQTAVSRRIVVSIPDCKLAILQSGKVIKIYSTAVGAVGSPSPAGKYTIVTRLTEPTWYGKGKIVGPGKNNPLGTRWLGLSVLGYGIHGTNAPASIGHNASHGCIRMRNRDVEELFAMVSVGDEVELYGQRTPELNEIFAVETVAAGTQ